MAKTRKPKLSDYQKKLLDPRWQRKRLEIMEAADWCCQWCGSKTKSLHVHHGYYRKKADPWDYADEYLHTLCYGCHEKAETERSELYRVIGMIPPSAIGGLFEATVNYAATALPEKVEERAQAPSDPEPEINPEDRRETTEEEFAEWIAEMRNFFDSK